MKLQGWHVEGFGLLNDFRVEDLPNGLTVVLGPNEAGKTSLLAFIRGVLFGYPDRRKKERQYLPLRGGRHGGRLFLEVDGGSWTVERLGAPARLTITRPDGAAGSDGDLGKLLADVDAELHSNVFAFSLAELQAFESLEVEGVRDRIFAAGVVGAGRSARAAIQELASRRLEIGRKRGESEINQLRKRIAELDGQLSQAKARAMRHPELRRALDDSESEQKRAGSGLTEARHELNRLEALLSAWPDWDERAQAEMDLAALADAPDLAEDLADRFKAARAAESASLERQAERQQAVVNLEQELTGLVPDNQLAAAAGEVHRLAAQSVLVRGRREKLRDLQHQQHALQQRVAEEAPRLGAGWTPETIRAFDTSIPTAQEVADWGSQLSQAQRAVHDAERRTSDHSANVAGLAAEVARITDAIALASPTPSADELDAQEGAVRKLRARLSELIALRAELAAAMVRVADLAAAVAASLCAGTLGTDTGGSIRQPASLCGIVGVKPTYGRVSRYGVIAFASSLDHPGPFGRTVEDAAALLEVIAGHDPMDSTSIPQPVGRYREACKAGLAGMRVGVPKEYFQSGMDPEIEAAVQAALDELGRAGAKLVPVSLPHTQYAIATYYLICTAEASSNLARYDGVRYGHRAAEASSLEELYARTRGEGFGKEPKRRIVLGTYVLRAGYYEAYYGKALRVRRLIADDFTAAFAECDVLVTPTSPTAAFKLGERAADPLQMYLADIYTVAPPLAGVPALSQCCGFTRAGLPIGLQTIGPPLGEEAMFRLAGAYQDRTDWHTRLPQDPSS